MKTAGRKILFILLVVFVLLGGSCKNSTSPQKKEMEIVKKELADLSDDLAKLAKSDEPNFMEEVESSLLQFDEKMQEFESMLENMDGDADSVTLNNVERLKRQRKELGRLMKELEAKALDSLRMVSPQ